MTGIPAAHRVAVAEPGPAAAPYLEAASDTRKQPALLADAGVACDAGTTTPADVTYAYRTWIGELAGSLGNRTAVVVVRAGTTGAKCPAPRAALLDAVVTRLHTAAPRAMVFADVSDLAAASPASVATFLDAIPTGHLTGIAVDVGMTQGDAEVAAAVAGIRRGDLRVLQDSSRSGGTAAGACNPPGAKLGASLSAGHDPAAVERM